MKGFEYTKKSKEKGEMKRELKRQGKYQDYLKTAYAGGMASVEPYARKMGLKPKSPPAAKYGKAAVGQIKEEMSAKESQWGGMTEKERKKFKRIGE